MQSLQENKSTKTIIIVVVSMILVGLIIFTKKMIDKYSKEAEVPSIEVAQTMEGATPVVVDTPVNPEAEASEATTETAATPTATATATPTPAKAASPLSAFTSTAAPTPAVSSQASPTAAANAKPAAGPTENSSNAANKPVETAAPMAAASASPSPSATATPTPTPKPESNKPVELIVEALDTVDIEYAAPNGKLQKIKLSAEQVHTFKSRSGLKINFSNGGAVNLIMNGKEIGIPGDLGKPIKLSY